MIDRRYWAYLWPTRGPTAYEMQFGSFCGQWCYLRGGGWWDTWYWWAQPTRFGYFWESK